MGELKEFFALGVSVPPDPPRSATRRFAVTKLSQPLPLVFARRGCDLGGAGPPTPPKNIFYLPEGFYDLPPIRRSFLVTKPQEKTTTIQRG